MPALGSDGMRSGTGRNRPVAQEGPAYSAEEALWRLRRAWREERARPESAERAADLRAIQVHAEVVKILDAQGFWGS